VNGTNQLYLSVSSAFKIREGENYTEWGWISSPGNGSGTREVMQLLRMMEGNRHSGEELTVNGTKAN